MNKSWGNGCVARAEFIMNYSRKMDLRTTNEEIPEIFSEISQISAEEFLSKSEEEQAQIWNNSNLAR